MEQRMSKWDRRGERAERDFEDRPLRTLFKWVLGAVAILAVLGLVVGAIFGITNWVGSWGNKAADVVGPQNVEKQYNVIIDNWESLTKAADNACAAQASAGSTDTLLVESPAFAYASTYRTVRAKYNQAFANVFDAGLVGPPGYPREIPNWTSGENPNFCTVSTQLAELKETS